jgi:hypothetical protein
VRDMVLTDGERLVAFVRAGQPPTFDIHVLEDFETTSTSLREEVVVEDVQETQDRSPSVAAALATERISRASL